MGRRVYFMNDGWIKLHRQITEWEWYQSPNVMSVFLHCLLKANHKAKKWQGILINKGEFITSYQNMSNELSGRHNKISTMQVRTALDKLKSTGEITIKATNKFSLIKINKWESYQQDNKQECTQITNKQQTNNKQITTNKNDKKEKNIYMERVKLTEEEYAKLVEEFGEQGANDRIRNLSFYIGSKGDKYKNHYLTILNWERKNNANAPAFIPLPKNATYD